MCTGVTLPLLQQSVLFFNLALSYLLLKKGLAWEQVAGVALVAGGVAAAAWPTSAGSSVFQQVSIAPELPQYSDDHLSILNPTCFNDGTIGVSYLMEATCVHHNTEAKVET